MTIEQIRKMTDTELEIFLSRITYKKNNNCVKCGGTPTKRIKVENLETYQTKNLCKVCDSCYNRLLNNLQVSDIEWER